MCQSRRRVEVEALATKIDARLVCVISAICSFPSFHFTFTSRSWRDLLYPRLATAPKSKPLFGHVLLASGKIIYSRIQWAITLLKKQRQVLKRVDQLVKSLHAHFDHNLILNDSHQLQLVFGRRQPFTTCFAEHANRESKAGIDIEIGVKKLSAIYNKHKIRLYRVCQNAGR